MDTKSKDGPHPEFDRGEWAMLGFDNREKEPMMVLSPFWEDIPREKKIALLKGWFKVVFLEYDKLRAEHEKSRRP